MKPRLLDLFCGAGGAAKGYADAGFEVVGVDHRPQPRYPFEFHQADALTFPLDGFDAIHASPPCHAYSNVTGRNRKNRRRYPDLVAPMRERLVESGVPWVIENVPGAPLRFAITLCGSMFSLDVRRHRVFESSFTMLAPECQHHRQAPRFRSLDSRQKTLASVIGVHGHTNFEGELALRQVAMGIDWMTNAEVTQAIPPAYTRLIGRQLMTIVRRSGRFAPTPS